MNNAEIYTITINNKSYQVFIRKKKIKRIIIRVDQRNRISLNCPFRCSYQEAYNYLNEHLDWLEKAISKNDNNFDNMFVDECLNKQKIWLLGKLYNIVIDISINSSFIFIDNNLYIKNNIDNTVEQVKESLYDKIIDEFNHCYNSFTNHIKQKPYLEFRKMKSRWGSCNYRTGRIVMNKILVHVPIELIRYVMIHEFVHFVHPNHSKDFHNFLKQCVPDYKLLEKELKKYSFLLQI